MKEAVKEVKENYNGPKEILDKIEKYPHIILQEDEYDKRTVKVWDKETFCAYFGDDMKDISAEVYDRLIKNFNRIISNAAKENKDVFYAFVVDSLRDNDVKVDKVITLLKDLSKSINVELPEKIEEIIEKSFEELTKKLHEIEDLLVAKGIKNIQEINYGRAEPFRKRGLNFIDVCNGLDVKTKQVKVVVDSIKKHKFVLLRGVSNSGKTSLLSQVAFELKDEYVVLMRYSNTSSIDYPDKLAEYFSEISRLKEKKVLLVCDDVTRDPEIFKLYKYIKNDDNVSLLFAATTQYLETFFERNINITSPYAEDIGVVRDEFEKIDIKNLDDEEILSFKEKYEEIFEKVDKSPERLKEESRGIVGRLVSVLKNETPNEETYAEQVINTFKENQKKLSALAIVSFADVLIGGLPEDLSKKEKELKK